MRLSELFEGRNATLFHGTDVNSAMQIVEEDALRPNTVHILPDRDRKVEGVSLSRNAAFATRFSKGIVFELDERALSQTNKIVPFNYWNRTNNRARDPGHSRWNEYEEFVVGAITPLSRYLVRIWIDTPSFRWLEPWAQDAAANLLKHPKGREGRPSNAYELRAAQGKAA